MTARKIRLGLVDSGVSEHQAGHIKESCGFSPEGVLPVRPDPLGHGTTVCGIIRHHAPDIALYNAQVFDGRGVTTAATVAAALDWLVTEKVDLINLSLGLVQDRAVLKAAVSRAIDAGIILVAASPAQGAAVYPSAYPGVIRATGDARCATGEVSFLDSAQADFGACPRGLEALGPQRPRIGGASLGTAHLSGQLAACLRAGGKGENAREWLVSRAKYVHSERRTE
ncbi:MAG: S8 family serine peptidase [Rhodobacteraceae bacterium]|nr:S8 family serine peptidase [Paracoccaceae bacterium]